MKLTPSRFVKGCVAAAALLTGVAVQGAVVNITSADIIGTNHWYKTNTYVLDGFVYVETNEVVNIEAGTVIKAKAGTGAASSALFVTRGGKIFANGTAAEPIIFTSVLDSSVGATGLDLGEKPNLDPATESGKWGGITLLGNAVLNSAADPTGDAATPKYDLYEGQPDTLFNGRNVFRFGGGDDTDSSGVLRYVSIRYTGVELALDKELNGLTMGGVGSGTVLDHVEVYGGTDDGFEWWGGTVSGKWLAGSFIQDDIFDADQGYRGTNQFVFGWAFNNGTQLTDKGMELDGEVGTVDGSLPVARYSFYNTTLIGAGGKALKLRDHSGLRLHNSIITGFVGGLDYEADQQAAFDAGELIISHNIFEGASFAADVDITGGDVFFTDALRKNVNVSPALRSGVAPLDPRPAAGSPALDPANVFFAQDSFIDPAPFQGAFAPDNLWLRGWTALDSKGHSVSFGATVGNVVTVTSANIHGKTYWTKDNTYVLDGFVYVEDGEELHIEAGTVVKAKAGTGAASSALFVTRGGKIFANGSRQQPIIFTSVLDSSVGATGLDLGEKPNLNPATESGKWGGITLLGNAVLNSAADPTGDAATPKYDLYEGQPDTLFNGRNVFRFGGGDDTDSSGVLRYVSIRYTGVELALDKELNGLTMGGVGSGTVLDHVEVYGGTDDGFEWWGGTVSGKWLAGSFIQDDIFDADQGYRGTNQFVFGWAFNNGTQLTDKGMELDGEVGTVDGSLPIARYSFYNTTLIGAGGKALKLRDHSGLRLHNSIITGFVGGLDYEADQQAAFDAGELIISHNIFEGASFAADVDITGGDVFFTDTLRKNQNLNPQLNSATGTLDPRPAAGSPALDPANALAIAAGGFLSPVQRVGAFDAVGNWLDGWSALSQRGNVVGMGRGATVNVLGSDANSIGASTVWYNTNTYVLDGFVYVETNEVLTIQPGTVIKAKAGTGAASSALFVTRGGRIIADGTVDNPIIFTSVLDSSVGVTGLDLGEKAKLDPATESGKWGGVTLLGRAVLNSAADPTGDAATPKHDLYEGQPDTVFNGRNVFRFGGSDDSDNSGVLRYVSIRYTGVELALDKELNGLTMGGVGSGTILENVEVYGGTDDGFEWWGGTVNGKYLVGSHIQDDIFDADQGYRGKNQFVFGVAFNNGTQLTDKGMELDGEVGTVDGSLPIARYSFYNVTLLGAGGKALKLRDHSGLRLHNSIITGFVGGLDYEADQQAAFDAGELIITHNIFEGAAHSADADITGGNVFFTDGARSNFNVSPMFEVATGGRLSPFPTVFSVALNPANTKPEPADGFYSDVHFLGAFGDVNWASDWTALSRSMQLSGRHPGRPNYPLAQAGGVPVIAVQPVNASGNAGANLTLSANATGDNLTYQWYKDGVAINGATGASLQLNNAKGNPGLNWSGPSSSEAPYQESLVPGWTFRSILSVGDWVNHKADGVTPYRAVGIMDGLGAFDNGNGTFTVLINHEINESSGVTRHHGQKGAFVSRWAIDKNTLAVLSGQDQMTNVWVYDTNTSSFRIATGTEGLMGRFCSADLPAPGAFWNQATSKGTTNRIYMNGEEFSTQSRAWAHVVTGPGNGGSWQLPRLGRASWENVVASPHAQDKTIVAGLDDDGTTDSQVYFYIGTKQSTGTNDVEKAGLLNGSLFAVAVNGLALETDATTAIQRTFVLTNLGNVSLMGFDELENHGNTNGVTAFQRVEDGAWDVNDPTVFYFLTTASFSKPSRLWRLKFNDIANPENGGVLDMLLDGTEGIKMMDNMGVAAGGRGLIIQEDVGGNAHNGKTWFYTPASDQIHLVAQHKPNLVTTGAPGFRTQDEEASGVIDISHILGYPAHLVADQLHGTSGFLTGKYGAGLVSELIEDGQLAIFCRTDEGDYQVVVSNGSGSVTSAVATVTVAAPPSIGATRFRHTLPGASVANGGTFVLDVPADLVAGSGPFTYQWFRNGTLVGSTSTPMFTVANFTAANAGNYTVKVTNAAGNVTSENMPVVVADIAFFGGVIIDGPAGAKFRIEYLSDINNTNSWQTVTNSITHPGGRVPFIDFGSSGTVRRFFRAIPIP